MYNKIMVPVDLAHIDALEKSLRVAADLAQHFNAELCYVSVTTDIPGPVARTPDEYEQKLNQFAKEHGLAHGRPVSAHVFLSHDPAVDLNEILGKAITETGADLVVMGTHLPRHLDAIMPAHGGQLAAHTNASVFLVRP